jgi:hypothetical protein
MVPPVVPVSVLRCSPDKFVLVHQMMIEADSTSQSGTEAMSDLLVHYVSAEEAALPLTNASIW